MGTSHFEIRPRVSGFLVGIAVTVALLGCGAGSDVSIEGQDTRLTKAEFGVSADRICLEASSHFDELPDPVGGAKPVGLGGFMRKWVVKLRVLQPPARIADDWRAGLDLLDRAADRLDDAEAGDPEAQGEALWSLEAQAQKHFDAMHVPFGVCFVE